VATPPRVTRAELDAAVRRIHRRHERLDDPRRSELSDDPAQVLEYLTRHSGWLPQWALAQDTQDGLVLNVWLWWEDRRRQLALLRRGRRAGLYWRELGAPLGIDDQGARDRHDRYTALLAHDRPDEKLTREARRESAHAERHRAWVHAHTADIRAVLERLLTQLGRVPALAPALHPLPDAPEDSTPTAPGRPVDHTEKLAEAAAWLAELRVDLEKDSYSPATLAVLGLALTPLRQALSDLRIAPNHGLWTAIHAADELRSHLA
jgi:hypothetical protein